MEELGGIIRKFLPQSTLRIAESLFGGVIHQTYKIEVLQNGKVDHYILQCMNTDTFKNPDQVMKNTILVQEFLIKKGYPLQLSVPLPTADSKMLYVDDHGGYWRFFKFIKDTVSFEKTNSLDQLYEAAKAYGTFATFLKDLDVTKLEITIPDFHNLPVRFQVFEKILKNAPLKRSQNAADEIEKAVQFYHLFQNISFSHLPVRAVHNDCKLSNVLFDKNTQKCKAVIDLDTLMPGYIATDFGDMVRTMCNTATEDEKDLEKVVFDRESFQVLKKEFLANTSDWLSVSEKDNLINGAIYIILEQTIRFLSDYLNNDRYYMVKYPEHNLDRTKNQLKLLESMITDLKSL